MNPCLFQSLAGAASTFKPAQLAPQLATVYPAPSRSFGVRLVHSARTYGLSWVTPAPGFARAPLGTSIYYHNPDDMSTDVFRCLTPKP